MKYTPRHTFWTPLIFGILSLLWPTLFFTGFLNGRAFTVFEFCSVVFFYFSIIQNFIYLEIKDAILIYKKSGLKKWQVPVADIAMIDDTQSKSYKPDFATVLAHSRGNVIGFVLKTLSGQVFVMPTPIQNYPNFLNDLKVVNPAIQITKLTEALNQPLMDKVNKPLW